MQNHLYFSLPLIAAMFISGCALMQQNPSLAEAQNSYEHARANPMVASLAKPELAIADYYLQKANRAFSEHNSNDFVDHLAYLAKQQAAIAEQTAIWKTTELLVNTEMIKRNLALRLTKKAVDAAKRRTLIKQQTVDRHAIELAVAGGDP